MEENKMCIDSTKALAIKYVVDSWQVINTKISCSITGRILRCSLCRAQASHALFHSNLEGKMVNLMMTHPLSLELTCILGRKYCI